ncbi:glycine cleavage system aminomethyltransferase GcvT [Arachnia propionica]|uniref:aminomethyltransferase n=1 Tax=Arachnia propionica TaxID=1750 RepID=A0A3P1T810_9ACTN|nr:glycine cleavage system aminomethyltransferase GcvT [Arachnia propionica]RRD04966.1 glycine cleavage system aminomethyltransferase GcvT [Arachnia propionica]
MSPITTALHPLHVELGARLVDFAGWELPVSYSGVIAEHQHTRQAASLFDVSHMGQVWLRPTSGNLAEVATALERLTPASVLGLKTWRQRYGLFTDDNGGVLDDFMFANHEDRFHVVVNAARTEHDLALLRTLPGIEVEHLTDRALLALQGPRAEQALATLVPQATELVFMDSLPLTWNGVELWVSRSGYTGEDGFEISVPDDHAIPLARALLALDWVAPAGLGARDSLRLEAGMPLYGHELAPEITPVQAGLGWAIPKVRRSDGSRAGGYPGSEVILAELADGPTRLRVGLRPEGRAVVREGTPVFPDTEATTPIAQITSGGFGPSVGGPVAMAMLPTRYAPGQVVHAEVRGRRIPMTVTDLPLIPHSYKR